MKDNDIGSKTNEQTGPKGKMATVWAANMEMYMYGDASVEANKEMQEPLEKLYKYENQPDMRESIRDYIDKLCAKIKRCETEIANTKDVDYEARMMARLDALIEVRNDLLERLSE